METVSTGQVQKPQQEAGGTSGSGCGLQTGGEPFLSCKPVCVALLQLREMRSVVKSERTSGSGHKSDLGKRRVHKKTGNTTI